MRNGVKRFVRRCLILPESRDPFHSAELLKFVISLVRPYIGTFQLRQTDIHSRAAAAAAIQFASSYRRLILSGVFVYNNSVRKVACVTHNPLLLDC